MSRRMSSQLLAGLAGALFGVGLLLSGMTQPAKIIGFLDVLGGAWDPSLAFVMGGAIAVNAVAWRVTRHHTPWFDSHIHVPRRHHLDAGLLGGAAIFGVGWGLGGLCPGPALVSAAGGNTSAIVFTFCMLLGMAASHAFTKR